MYNWPTWSQNAARWSKNYIMTHQHTEPWNHFHWKTRNPHGTPLHVFRNPVEEQGRNQLFISRGAIFVKFHSMTSSFSFNRGTTFSQAVTYNNNNVFLPADTKSTVYKHTFCTTLANENRMFYNSVGGWITSVKRKIWLHAICVCTEQHSTYKICWENWWIGLRVWCLVKCVGLGFMLQSEKEK